MDSQSKSFAVYAGVALDDDSRMKKMQRGWKVEPRKYMEIQDIKRDIKTDFN